MRKYLSLLLIISLVIISCHKENLSEFAGLFNFEEKIIDENVSLLKVKFSDQNNGYIIGSYKKLFNTNDGGETWHEMEYNIEENPRSLEITDDKTIYIGKFGLYKSIDYGNSWNELGFIDWGGSTIFDICFINNDTGFIIKSDILKTTDAGQNWKNVLDLDSYLVGLSNIDRIIFPEKKNFGYAIGGATFDGMSGGIMFKTSNYGETWKKIDLSTSEITEIYFLNDSIGYIFNAYLEIYKTNNYGETWELVMEYSKCMYPKVQFLNDEEAIMIDNRNIYYTNNAFKALVLIYNAPEAMKYLVKYNSNTCIVIGSNGYYLSITKNES